MARQQKQTVDYFPHFTMHKKTLRLMRKNFGDAGYVFWFMLLEVLGATNGHFIDLNEKVPWKIYQTTQIKRRTK